MSRLSRELQSSLPGAFSSFLRISAKQVGQKRKGLTGVRERVLLISILGLFTQRCHTGQWTDLTYDQSGRSTYASYCSRWPAAKDPLTNLVGFPTQAPWQD